MPNAARAWGGNALPAGHIAHGDLEIFSSAKKKKKMPVGTPSDDAADNRIIVAGG